MKYNRIYIGVRIYFTLCFVFSLSSLAGQNLDMESSDARVGGLNELRFWLKGPAINRFHSDSIYIVEFGSVACGPCRASIPKLSELADVYSKGKVVIVSVFVYENASYPDDTISVGYVERVRRFVDGQGDGIRYRVAVDGPSRDLAKVWLEKHGLKGVPQAFIVVNGDSIGWVGHPFDLEIALRETIKANSGSSYDMSLVVNIDEVLSEVLPGLGSLNALVVLDSLITLYPNKLQLYGLKFRTLLAVDEVKAVQYAADLIGDRFGGAEYVLTGIATELVHHDFRQHFIKVRALNLVVSITTESRRQCRDELVESSIVQLQALAYYKIGRVGYSINLIDEQMMRVRRQWASADLSFGVLESLESYRSFFRSNQ